MGNLFGVITPVHVRHVYACNLISVELLSEDGTRTGDDLTIRLPVASNTLLRPGDPPLNALSLYDPAAADGRTSQALGPCPVARRYCRRRLQAARLVVLHLPIPNRRDWLASLLPGRIEYGDLYLDPPHLPSLSGAVRLATLLADVGHAQREEPDDRIA